MRKYKIIIVENDEDEQLFMKEGFEDSGLFEIVAQLRNGDALSEWLEIPQPILPDVILSDLNMPGKNGYDILEDIKNNPAFAHIPVIITSTSSSRISMEKCKELGAADYVVKPDTFIEYVPYAQQLHHLIEEKELVK